MKAIAWIIGILIVVYYFFNKTVPVGAAPASTGGSGIGSFFGFGASSPSINVNSVPTGPTGSEINTTPSSAVGSGSIDPYHTISPLQPKITSRVSAATYTSADSGSSLPSIKENAIQARNGAYYVNNR